MKALHPFEAGDMSAIWLFCRKHHAGTEVEKETNNYKKCVRIKDMKKHRQCKTMGLASSFMFCSWIPGCLLWSYVSSCLFVEYIYLYKNPIESLDSSLISTLSISRGREWKRMDVGILQLTGYIERELVIHIIQSSSLSRTNINMFLHHCGTYFLYFSNQPCNIKKIMFMFSFVAKVQYLTCVHWSSLHSCGLLHFLL